MKSLTSVHNDFYYRAMTKLVLGVSWGIAGKPKLLHPSKSFFLTFTQTFSYILYSNTPVCHEMEISGQGSLSPSIHGHCCCIGWLDCGVVYGAVVGVDRDKTTTRNKTDEKLQGAISRA